jgi:DNA invertase Pin-like site-specific DNA recombinase
MWNTPKTMVPKNPNGVLYVLLIGRISTPHQDLSNIEASFVPLRKMIAELYDGEVQIKQLGERGSGMDPNRESIREAEDEIDRGIVDLVVLEDISRAHRNMQYLVGFVQNSFDHGTRVIAPGDGLDTFDENWEAILAAAAMRHGMQIPDTRRRVKRTAAFGFLRGGMVQKVMFGYRKLTKDEANSGQFGPKGLRIVKLVECTPIILEMKRRVMRGDSYPAIAKWLNSEGISPGPYVKLGRWTGRLVNCLLRSPLLSGTRTFRNVAHQRIYKTGKFKRTKNPTPDKMEHVELAHMSREEQEALWKVMDARDAKKGKRQPHRRKDTAREDTLWPGQHLSCPFCHDKLYWNSPTLLKCRNTISGRSTDCWNQVLVNAEQVRQKLLPKLVEALSAQPGLLDVLINAAWAEFERSANLYNRKRTADEKRLKEYVGDAQTLAKAIAKQPLDTLIAELDKTENEIKKLKTELARDQKQREQETRFLSREDIVARLPEALLELSRTSFEFCAVMREMFPDFYVQPIQALDTPQARTKPRLTLDFFTPTAWQARSSTPS